MNWPTKLLPVTSLHLDTRNPRLGRDGSTLAPGDIVRHLFEHDRVLEVAESIAVRGFFPNEPLLAIKDPCGTIVVEGNRRLAALMALRNPGLLEGAMSRAVEKLAKRIDTPQDIASVPVTLAPSRRATDRQVAGRHVGTPVLAWRTENRARFILEKLDEGYDAAGLAGELGFSEGDIQKARQTRAIADMARAIELPPDVRRRLERPRANVLTTLERVFDSSVGRQFFGVQPSLEHGLEGTIPRSEFVRGFSKLVSDVALGKASSRTLNKNEDIQRYLEKWPENARPKHTKGTFVPDDVVGSQRAATVTTRTPTPPARMGVRKASTTVLPKDLKVLVGEERLREVRNELIRLKRDEFPNAGAVLLRVFFELAAVSYLRRTGELVRLVERLKKGGKQLPFDVPPMKYIAPELVSLAKKHLAKADAIKVEKALRHDPAAPFSLADLHSFVHDAREIPGERDIRQFWLRIEPLLRLMVEQLPRGESK